MDGTRVRRNDWGTLTPPPIGGARPTRTVSVIIPAYRRQDLLDLALAALARQTYPHELFEVIVVDDGSEPKLELPPLAPLHTRLVRAADHSTGWGRANALHVGATCADGDILHWLDADMVTYPEHVEAQARWHHVTTDAVTLGYKRFVPRGPWPTPQQVYDGPVADLFAADECEPHDYIEELIQATDGLRQADHLAFRAHVGATAALPRELYHDAGGLDTSLRLGEDSEFGYRLAQAGAVFIPEPQARSWHLGPSSMMRNGHALRRYNRPFLAEAMPQPPWLRSRSTGRNWRVPTAQVIVEADGPAELVHTCVDRVLASDLPDLHVVLVGAWDALTDHRRHVLDDPLLDLRLVAAAYRSDPRVSLAGTAPESAFPAPYQIRVPARLGVATHTIARMIAEADRHQAGLLHVMPAGGGAGTSPPAAELWRTAAVSRAQRHRHTQPALPRAVAEMWDARWVSSDDFGLVDLAAQTDPDTQPRSSETHVDASDPQAGPVPVAGLRSLLRATVYVARLAARRVRHKLTG